MGGILIRTIQKHQPLGNLGRVDVNIVAEQEEGIGFVPIDRRPHALIPGRVTSAPAEDDVKGFVQLVRKLQVQRERCFRQVIIDKHLIGIIQTRFQAGYPNGSSVVVLGLCLAVK